MTQQFDEHGRHDGHAALAVVRFFEWAARPLRRYMTQVFRDLGLYIIREVAVHFLAVSAVTQHLLSLIVMRRVDTECADDGGVILAIQSVGVQGEAEVHGSLQ